MYTRHIISVLLLLIFTFIYENSSSSPDEKLGPDIEVRACGPNKALNCTKFYLCKHSDEIDQFDFKAHNDSFQNECEPGMECCEPRTEDQRVLKRIKKNDVGPYDKCGKRSPKGVQYEVKDFPNNRSQQGEFPWTIAIINEIDMTEVYCIGSLIHPRVVLAAAHNFVDKKGNPLGISQFILRAGEWDVTTTEDAEHQDQRIERIVLHNFVKRPVPDNDIALLFTKMLFTLGENVRTICLPKTTDTFVWKTCVAAGWGSDTWTSGKRSIQKKVELMVVSKTDCENELRSTRLGQQFTLPPGTSMCAKPTRMADTCYGDGDAALACLTPDSGYDISSVPANDDDGETYVQAGIASWRVGCANGLTSVYTNVAMYTDWIDLNMGDLDRTYYTY